MAYGEGNYFGALQQPTIGLKNYSVGSQSEAANILEVGSNPKFPRVKIINPYSAPMRWGKYVKYNNLGNPTKQTVEYVPQRSNYVYHATPKYDYKKAFYKYPQYRKWDSKLQESFKHEWTTDFSGIPGRKIDTIQYHWNKNAVPIGAITGDMYNNMNTFDMANPYYLRQLNQEWETTIAEVSQMRSLGYFFKLINIHPQIFINK